MEEERRREKGNRESELRHRNKENPSLVGKQRGTRRTGKIVTVTLAAA